MDQLGEILTQNHIEYKQQVAMKTCTTFQIGGPADWVVYPQSTTQAARLVEILNQNRIPWLVMGNGSNLLVNDDGIRGVVIKTDRMNNIVLSDNQMTVGAGCLNVTAANAALKAGLSGLEFAHGIPGSIGGAVYMNAGAYGSQFSDIVITTTYIDPDGKIQIKDLAAHEFGYRHSSFTEKNIICETCLQLTPGNPDQIRAKMQDLMQRRRDRQPLTYPSAGSVFKRPEGHYAGQLIEECGLKGLTVGGAQVSPKHAGFIVNTGNATAKDVQTLIGRIQDEVYQKFGVKLEIEVKMV